MPASSSNVMFESAGSDDEIEHAGRSERTRDEARALRRGKTIGCDAREFGGPQVDLAGALA